MNPLCLNKEAEMRCTSVGGRELALTFFDVLPVRGVRCLAAGVVMFPVQLGLRSNRWSREQVCGVKCEAWVSDCKTSGILGVHKCGCGGMDRGRGPLWKEKSGC
jgi:hypothetical protein